MNHFAVLLKLRQHCKSTAFQKQQQKKQMKGKFNQVTNLKGGVKRVDDQEEAVMSNGPSPPLYVNNYINIWIVLNDDVANEKSTNNLG